MLEKQLASWKDIIIDPVMVASATDAYQPIELKFEITRRCIEVLQKYNVPYYVFTKSILIKRDLELYKRYAGNCCVIWSITTCNEKIKRIIEPGTSPADKMFQVIEMFRKSGVLCAVNIDPIPYYHSLQIRNKIWSSLLIAAGKQ